jgi:hypothetical protein
MMPAGMRESVYGTADADELRRRVVICATPSPLSRGLGLSFPPSLSLTSHLLLALAPCPRLQGTHFEVVYPGTNQLLYQQGFPQLQDTIPVTLGIRSYTFFQVCFLCSFC